jgi:hypothetical protein
MALWRCSVGGACREEQIVVRCDDELEGLSSGSLMRGCLSLEGSRVVGREVDQLLAGISLAQERQLPVLGRGVEVAL